MKKVIQVIADILAWVLLIIAFLITLMVFASGRNNGIPSLFGYMFMSVQTDSMAPTFESGDVIIVKGVDDFYKLQEKDVITFYTFVEGKRIINTHRIVGVNEEGNSRSFTTRGDNNYVDDDLPVGASEIIGKWTGKRIKGLGRILDFLQTKTGFFVCIVVPLAIFFIFELYKFVVALIEAKKPEISEEEAEEIKRKAVEEYLASQKKDDEKDADKDESDADSGGDKEESGDDAGTDKAE